MKKILATIMAGISINSFAQDIPPTPFYCSKYVKCYQDSICEMSDGLLGRWFIGPSHWHKDHKMTGTFLRAEEFSYDVQGVAHGVRCVYDNTAEFSTRKDGFRRDHLSNKNWTVSQAQTNFECKDHQFNECLILTTNDPYRVSVKPLPAKFACPSSILCAGGKCEFPSTRTHNDPIAMVFTFEKHVKSQQTNPLLWVKAVGYEKYTQCAYQDKGKREPIIYATTKKSPAIVYDNHNYAWKAFNDHFECKEDDRDVCLMRVVPN